MSEPVGKVLIYFGGICTFLEDFRQFTSSSDDPPVRRMVIANAHVKSIPMGGGEKVHVAKHLARLRFHTPFRIEKGQLPPRVENTDEYDLNQASAYTISVLDPIIPPSLNLLWTNNAGCLPSLQGSLPLDVKISPPSIPVIAGGNAACYVDFTHGSIEGFTVDTNDMGIARATIFTQGPPRLGIAQNGEITAIVRLEGDPAVLAITNKPPTPGTDSPNDFLLNFLIVENPPFRHEVAPPQEVFCQKINRESDPHLPPEFVTADAGPGCSTTDYP